MQGASGRRAVALIDGEHYPEVTRDALAYAESELGYEVVACVFLGGTEKLAGDASSIVTTVPVFAGRGQLEDLRAALAAHRPDVVLDLSDEPVLDYRRRFRLISEALAAGASYYGADFAYRAPRRPFACAMPALGVWGTGKRVGKTAIAGYMARYLAGKGANPCVLTMGRGGPREPELLDSPEAVDDEYLRARAEEGCHAASDHFEDAMMGRVRTVGCRRCGGGMAGEPFYSNVPAGAALACAQPADILVAEGSGASIPPVGVDAAMLVTSAGQADENLLAFLGPYRLLLSDSVVVTMCEDFLVSSEKLRKLIDGVLSINPEVKVLKTVFRPRPLVDIEGKRVFLTSTAPSQAVEIQGKHLAEEYGAEVVGTSGNLADRKRLREDLEKAAGAELLVTELKAAGVDTVSTYASAHGMGLVYLENLPVCLEGSLEEEIDRLESLARRRAASRERSPTGY